MGFMLESVGRYPEKKKSVIFQSDLLNKIEYNCLKINRKIRYKLILFALFLIIFPTVVSAFLISDQGTNVREVATGNLTASANLSISIYDSSIGGNLIFEQTLINAIINGSWNVMINPNLSYGVIYWKDYSINAEDLDFDGIERLELQSSVGKINNISFINFSLINSCPEGSSIRLIYENGSVLCVLTNTSFNQTFTDLFYAGIQWAYNMTTPFTNWLTTFNYDYNQTTPAIAYTDAALVANNNSFRSTYNETYNASIIWAYNQTIVTNESMYNAYGNFWFNQTTPAIAYTDAALVANNNSFRSTYNETYNASIIWAYNQTIVTNESMYNAYGNFWFNQTTPAIAYTDAALVANNDSWLSTYNATYDTNIENKSWNESYATTLYASIIWAYNQSSASGGNISGDGTSTYIPQFSGQNTIGNSNMLISANSLIPSTNGLLSLGTNDYRWFNSTQNNTYTKTINPLDSEAIDLNGTLNLGMLKGYGSNPATVNGTFNISNAAGTGGMSFQQVSNSFLLKTQGSATYFSLNGVMLITSTYASMSNSLWASNLSPQTTNALSLGTSSKRWNNSFINNMYGNNLILGNGNLNEGYNVSVNGSMYVANNISGNLIYGELFNHSYGGFFQVDLATQDVYVQITNLTCGHINGFSCTAEKGNLTAMVTGVYKISVTLSAEAVGTAGEYGTKLFINGTGQGDCYGFNEFQNGISSSGGFNCITKLNGGDTINVGMDDHLDPVRDAIVNSFNINVVRIGN